ncbi:hypothetical protein APA50_32235 [Pseudomonas aeruginosa]|nr:hypothetical protein APA50_32235 [Pseudomonas aeruginosa]
MFWNPWGVRRHAHLALVHTSIEHSRDWCRSLLILNCQELAAQQPLRPINWCSRLLKMTNGAFVSLQGASFGPYRINVGTSNYDNDCRRYYFYNQSAGTTHCAFRPLYNPGLAL